MAETTVFFAFAAGLLSFLSPCMLPIIPAYISHMAGVNLEGEFSRKKVFLTAVMFVAGFSIVFGVMGVALNSVLESAGNQLLHYASLVAGTLVMVFGAHLSGVVEIRGMEKSYGTGIGDRLGSGYLSSVALGGAFAVGWTPCVGPLLGSVLALASASPGSAFLLLMAYSVGLGTPFLMVGLFPEQLKEMMLENQETVGKLQTGFGYIMILVGLLIATQNLSLLASFGFLNEVLL